MLVSLFTGIFLLTSEPADTSYLSPVTVVAARQRIAPGQLPSPSVEIGREEIRRQGIVRPNSLSSIVPGLSIPDYGASLTSTIYIRGLGSRMENPSIALYIDDIPILDKNAYDFDWSVIRNAFMLRGPQATLYGRNSIGGVLALNTGSTSDDAVSSGFLEAGTAGTFRIGLTYAGINNLVSAGLRRSGGYFRNDYTGRNCDPYTGGQIHWKTGKRLSSRTSFTNTLLLNASSEGGFAYGRYEDGKLKPVSYNGEGSYRRLSVIEGAKLQHPGDVLVTDAATSLQLLLDRMRMDQDFTPESIFTLEQRQGSGAVTGEITLRPAKTFTHWKPATGVLAFGRRNRMKAPVVFKEDGIRTLILENANGNIPASIGHLDIADQEFTVNSDFVIWTWNAALYHESVFSLGHWLLTAGLRIDCEGGLMSYDSDALIHYQFLPRMASAKPFRTAYSGDVSQNSCVLLPKLSALYSTGDCALYANISKGFRGGGFNTQIFSDILQGRMMTGMMEDLGVYLDNQPAGVTAKHTVYQPEWAWNYEAGIRYRSKDRFKAELNAYRIDCRNQQLTVFPPGKSTGRMMTNAGRSGISGIESEAVLRTGAFQLQAAYSWCDARFTEYEDGNADYAGKRVPYVPEHTLFAAASYGFGIRDVRLNFSADIRGTGPFRWNEENSLSEPFSIILGGCASAGFGKAVLYVRGDNLADRQSRCFYFKSVGREFLALSKPRRLTIGINYNL